MKRKVVLILLTLVLALGGLMPATAVLAAKPDVTVASGYIGSISDTVVGVNVFPTKNGGWKVVGREIGGVFTAGLPGPFVLTYDAKVDASQAGNLKGTLEAGGYEIDVKGDSGSAAFYGMYPDPVSGPYPLYAIQISGQWKVKEDDTKGKGDFTASLVFIPSADGAHIAAVIPNLSPVTLTGRLVDKSDKPGKGDKPGK